MTDTHHILERMQKVAEYDCLRQALANCNAHDLTYPWNKVRMDRKNALEEELWPGSNA